MKKYILDLFMVILFLLLVSFQQLPKLLHEVLGVIFLIAVIAHIYLNRGYFSSLAKGKWNSFRVCQAVMNFSLLITFLWAVVTGIFLSNYLFKSFVPLELARSISIHSHHVSLPFLMIVLCGIHLGFHGKILLNKFLTNRNKFVTNVMIFVIISFGVYISFSNRIGDRLLQKHIFATPATEFNLPVYFMLHLALFLCYAILGFYISKTLAKK